MKGLHLYITTMKWSMKQVYIMCRYQETGGTLTISAQSRKAIPSNLPAENHLLVYGSGTAWWRRLDIVGVVLEHGHTLYAGQGEK